jgi:serine/threonine protein kinase
MAEKLLVVKCEKRKEENSSLLLLYLSWKINKIRDPHRIFSWIIDLSWLIFSYYVFKQGVLKNERVVAVKKLAISQSHRAKEEFEKEVKIISNVHHRNLIRLLGCCSNGPELLLVYEYMANSSLDNFLYGNLNFVCTSFS